MQICPPKLELLPNRIHLFSVIERGPSVYAMSRQKRKSSSTSSPTFRMMGQQSHPLLSPEPSRAYGTTL